MSEQRRQEERYLCHTKFPSNFTHTTWLTSFVLLAYDEDLRMGLGDLSSRGRAAFAKTEQEKEKGRAVPFFIVRKGKFYIGLFAIFLVFVLLLSTTLFAVTWSIQFPFRLPQYVRILHFMWTQRGVPEEDPSSGKKATERAATSSAS